MPVQRADEAKVANIAKMGETLGKVYSALWQEVAVLHFDWHEYVELFGTKASRIDLMNATAPHLFRLLQDRLWETTLLHLARLTDPAVSPGKGERTNLSIEVLPELIDDANLRSELTQLIDEAVKLTEFARDWRNRYIGHRDLKLVLQQPTAPLADASRQDVKKALVAIASILNAVAAHYLDSYSAFDFGTPIGGAISLLYVLGIGSRAEEQRGKRLEAGKPTPEDLVVHEV